MNIINALHSHLRHFLATKPILLIEAGWRIYASVKHTNVASDNGLSPIRCQAIIWTNAAVLSIRRQETYFSEISSKIRKFSVNKMHLKMSSVKWWPFCLGLNVFNGHQLQYNETVTNTTAVIQYAACLAQNGMISGLSSIWLCSGKDCNKILIL